MRLWIITTPILLITVLQMSGCTSPDVAQTPPGAIYRSSSAGALFEQSVALTNKSADGTDNIAQFSLKGAHRPLPESDAVYVAAGNRGYVVSRDDGLTWTQVSVPLANVVDIAALEQEIVVVTGTDSTGQGHILRTSDVGQSWQNVLTIPVPTKSTGAAAFRLGNKDEDATVVISITPDPFDPNRLYAGTSLGNIFVGEQFAKTWRKIHDLDNDAFSANQSKFAVADIIPSPHTAGDLLIITAGGQLYSLDARGQQSQIKTPQALGQSTTVLSAAFIAERPDALLLGVNDGAIFSRDRGQTWEQLSLPVDTPKRFNTVIVQVSPTNSRRLLIAINDAVYRSEDGGQTWNSFSLNLPNHVITSLLINPANAAHVLAVTSPLPS